MKSKYMIRNLILPILIACSLSGYAQDKDSRIFNDSTLKISEIGTNSVKSDFGPAVIRDSLFFTTFCDKLKDKNNRKIRKKEFYDLYKTAIDSLGNTTGPREPLSEFITRYHDGPLSYCAQTGELFITQNYFDQSIDSLPVREETNRLRIIMAKKINGKWELVSEFPYNNPEYSVGHPAINETGDTLIFSSDRAGGFGQTDLYLSVRENGKWSLPVNLGPGINTSGKEEFAFITDRNLNGSFLIFASTGRFGKGNFDLYYTRFPVGISKVFHFEAPINSPGDDFAMTIPRDAEFGYLTSNRPGTGDDDIYKFTFKRILSPDNYRLELYTYDQQSRRPIPGVRIESCDKALYMSDAQGKVTALKPDRHCPVKATTFGYPETLKTLALPDGKNRLIRDTIWMELQVNQKIILKNIYYDFDKSEILPESAKELDQVVALMKQNPTLTVQLTSHTDCRGTKKYNLQLSQKRAQSAVDYIISQNICPDRITGKGRGESEPLNHCTDGVDCPPEQHRENRRTEIYIPGIGRGENIPQI